MVWGNRPRYEGGGRTFRNKIFAWSLAKQLKVPPSTGNAAHTGMKADFGNGRVTDNLVNLWMCNEESGNILVDSATLTPQANFTVFGGERVLAPEGRYVYSTSAGNASGTLSDNGNAEMFNSIAVPPTSAQGLTVEAWINPNGVSQSGPARIITMSEPDPAYASHNFNIVLGQVQDDIEVRVRTKENKDPDTRNEDCLTVVASNVLTNNLQHVVTTVEGDFINEKYIVKIYIDGVLHTSESYDFEDQPIVSNVGLFQHDGGIDWSSWYKTAIGSPAGTYDATRNWQGLYYLLAIYNRALDAGEVAINYQAGVVNDGISTPPTWTFAAPSSVDVDADTQTYGGIEVLRNGSVNTDSTVVVSLSSGDFTIGPGAGNLNSNCEPPKTLTFSKNTYSKSDSIKFTPGKNCPTGTVTFTLSGPSVGSVGAQFQHTVNVSSTDGVPDLSFNTSSQNVYQIFPKNSFSFTSTKYNDVNTIGFTGSANIDNFSTYVMIDKNGVHIPIDGVSVAEIDLAAFDTVSSISVSGDPGTNGFNVGDSFLLSGFSATSGTWTPYRTNLVTVVEAPSTEVPGPHNTGPNIQFKDAIVLGDAPVGDWWGDVGGGKFNILPGDYTGSTFDGYAFVNRKLKPLSTLNATFTNCWFVRNSSSGKITNGASHVDNSYGPPNEFGTSAISFINCTFSGTNTAPGWSNVPGRSNLHLINLNGIKEVRRCNIGDSTADALARVTQHNAVSGDSHINTTTIAENYFHDLGIYSSWDPNDCDCRGDWYNCNSDCSNPECGTCPTPHSDAIQTGKSSKCDMFVSGNSFLNAKRNAMTADGMKKCNCCNNPDMEYIGSNYGSFKCVPSQAMAINYVFANVTNNGCLTCSNPKNGGYSFGDVYFTDNWFNGGNAQIVLGIEDESNPDYNDASSSQNFVVSGNKMGNDYFGQPIHYTESLGHPHWTGSFTVRDNVWWATGELIGVNGNFSKPYFDDGTQWGSWRPGMRHQCAENWEDYDPGKDEDHKWICSGVEYICSNDCDNPTPPYHDGCTNCDEFS